MGYVLRSIHSKWCGRADLAIRKAAKVAKFSAVEVEFSLWFCEILSNGVSKACSRAKYPRCRVFAYEKRVSGKWRSF